MTTYRKAPLPDLADHMDKEASRLQNKFTSIIDFFQAPPVSTFKWEVR